MRNSKIKRILKNNKFILITIFFSLILFFSFILLLYNRYLNELKTMKEVISFYDYINIYDFISTIAVIAGIIVAIIELHANKKINEADYIKDLNKQFITNEEMVAVEHALETYNNKFFLGEKNIALDLDVRYDGKDRQKLVNYLVYLEGVSSIIDQGVLHIDKINSLFGYRYFLAVNNPVVQNIELYPFSTYYQGIFNVYDEWINKCKKKNSDVFMQVPLNDYKLNNKIHLAYNQRVRKAKPSDNLKKIASLIYQADNNIYSALFNNEEEAKQYLPELISKDNGFFSYNNILVLAQKEKQGDENPDTILGVLLFNDGTPKYLWNEKSIAKSMGKLSPSFKDVSKRYFSKYSKKRNDRIEIVALTVDKKYRSTDNSKKYYGFFLLNQFSSLFCDKKLSLEVLTDNKKAIGLYTKYFLFNIKDTYPGYSNTNTNIQAYKMEKMPLISINKK